MAIKKSLAGVEDITLGMGTEKQLRNGKEMTITQLNADKIPYDANQSIKKKMDLFTGEYKALRITIERHEADRSNPHGVTYQQVGAAPEVHTHDDRYFREDEHIQISSGALDAHKPLILNQSGAIDPTMLPEGSGLHPIGNFTPTSGNEYPDTSDQTPGAYWMVQGVDSQNGYTFTEGDLVGRTAYNGDVMILGSHTWLMRSFRELADEYYRLDGTQAITAPFAGGNQQFKNAANGTDDTDLTTIGQMKAADDTVRQEFMDADDTVRTEFQDADSNLQSSIDSVASDLSLHESADNPHNITTEKIGAEPEIGLGTAGQLLATNSTADGKEWVNPAPLGLGYGQTWQDMTAQREVNVEYVNGDRPIQVYIRTEDLGSGGGGGSVIRLEVNNVSIAVDANYEEYGRSQGGLIIPANATYKLVECLPSLHKWYELR